MKMLFTTSASEYREKLQRFFSEHNVTFYNEFEVNGVEKKSKPHRLGNWFGNAEPPLQKIAFFTLVEDDQADELMSKLMQCKQEMPECNIHGYLLNVEKGV